MNRPSETAGIPAAARRWRIAAPQHGKRFLCVKVSAKFAGSVFLYGQRFLPASPRRRPTEVIMKQPYRNKALLTLLIAAALGGAVVTDAMAQSDSGRKSSR